MMMNMIMNHWEMLKINNILNEDDLDSVFRLPPHHRCASHTLNLVATKDSEKAMLDPSYKKQMRITFSRLQSLWNKQDRSTLIADEIHDAFNVYIHVPNSTR